MADFLDYIEQNYGCVAEYNRCREEDAEFEAEQQYKLNQYYRKNKEVYDKANEEGKLVVFSESCYECPSYTDIGMTDSDDDIPHGICGNLSCKDCEYRIAEAKWKAECERREAEAKAMIKRAYTDTKTSENNKCLIQMLRERAYYLEKWDSSYDRLKTLINMYQESEGDVQLKIVETVYLTLGLSIEEITQKMLGEYKEEKK